MDLTKITLILCVFLVAVCLVFSISALTVLRNAVSETNQVRAEAQELLDDFGTYLKEQEREQASSNESSGDNTVPVDVLYDDFCMRESGGKIGIYTSDGYLIRLLDVSVDALPEADRQALKEGICVSSWKELLALIQDYTS